MNNYYSPPLETEDFTYFKYMIHHLQNSNDSLYQELANFIYKVQRVIILGFA